MNVLAILLAVLGISNAITWFTASHYANKARDQEIQAAQTRRYAEVADWVITASERNERLAKVVNQKQVEVREQIRTVTREVPVYVPQEAKAPFGPFTPVPFGLVRLHDSAALGTTLPESPPEPPFSPSPVTTVDAISVVFTNYEAARECHAQLEGWISWYENEAAKWNSPR